MFVTLTLLLWGAGCRSAYDRLAPTSRAPEFARLSEAARTTPERTTKVVINGAAGAPAHLAVHESGDGHRDTVLVMLHGAMSDSRVWRFVRPQLAGTYDVMSIDLPGCGDSDALARDDDGSVTCEPRGLARAALQAVRRRLAARPVPAAHVVFVGHSLGGSTVLRMFGDAGVASEFEDVLRKVSGLVLFSPADVAIEKALPTFENIMDTPAWVYDLVDATGALKEKTAEGVLAGTSDPRRALREEADRVYGILADPEHRRATQAMFRQFIPHESHRPDWARIKAIVEGYGRVHVPALIVWGYEDEVLPASMGHKLRNELPDARLLVVDDGMHCLPVEYPTLCAGVIEQFVRTGGAGWKPVAHASGGGSPAAAGIAAEVVAARPAATK